MAAKIKKGDHVVVIAGKDKGTKGEVLSVTYVLAKLIQMAASRLLRRLFIFQTFLNLIQKVASPHVLVSRH